MWVLLITDGTVVEFPPEIYLNHAYAATEAERWAWVLAGGGEMAIRRPFEGRWEVGVRDVRLVECRPKLFELAEAWWVGVHWTEDGYPDPEAKLLKGRDAAVTWTQEAPAGLQLSSTQLSESVVSSSFGEGMELSVAHRAKVVVGHDVELPPAVEYEVELIGTFVQGIRGAVQGPPGITRYQIEKLIEENWAELSAETEVLLDSSWELEGYHQVRPMSPVNP